MRLNETRYARTYVRMWGMAKSSSVKKKKKRLMTLKDEWSRNKSWYLNSINNQRKRKKSTTA